MLLGTKNFQAKQMAGRDAEGRMEQSAEWRGRETLNRFRSLFDLHQDNPEDFQVSP